MQIAANIVVGKEGATTQNGRSAALSSGADRERFHLLREGADCILIGGATARCEPYGKTPLPLFVISHSQEIPGSAAKNPKARLSRKGLADTLADIEERYESLLIEGGANLLKEALDMKVVDDLYLTQTVISGGAPYFHSDLHEAGLVLISEAPSPHRGELFLHYARLPMK
jgi:riboflavin biosynthesis pyrimidine reductase